MLTFEPDQGRLASPAPARKDVLSRRSAPIGRKPRLFTLPPPRGKHANSFPKICENPCKNPPRQPASTLKNLSRQPLPGAPPPIRPGPHPIPCAAAIHAKPLIIPRFFLTIPGVSAKFAKRLMKYPNVKIRPVT